MGSCGQNVSRKPYGGVIPIYSSKKKLCLNCLDHSRMKCIPVTETSWSQGRLWKGTRTSQGLPKSSSEVCWLEEDFPGAKVPSEVYGLEGAYLGQVDLPLE